MSSPSTHQDSPKVPETVEKIARAFHDEYQAWAEAKGWETQEATRTSFDGLPAENRETMLATVQALLDRKIIGAPAAQPAEAADRQPMIERLNHLAKEIALEKPHDAYVGETVVALDEAIALLKSPVIPVSALLSDEVVERIAKLDYEAAKLPLGTWEQLTEWLDGKYANGFREAAREKLQAAIEQVGGAK